MKNADGEKIYCPECENDSLTKKRSEENAVKGDESVVYYKCDECGHEFVEEDAMLQSDF